jgi:hypothetical protein
LGDSPILLVDSSAPSDDEMSVTVSSPACGDYFYEGTEIDLNVSVDDEDDFVKGNLSVYGIDGDYLTSYSYDNFGLWERYTFAEEGEYQIIADSENTRGDLHKYVSNVIVVDTAVDANYTAACLASPLSNQDYNRDVVWFDASPTRGIRVFGGVVTVVDPSMPDSFIWDWDFSTLDNSGNSLKGADLDSYNNVSDCWNATNHQDFWNFGLEYPRAGHKSATLEVRLSNGSAHFCS